MLGLEIASQPKTNLKRKNAVILKKQISLRTATNAQILSETVDLQKSNRFAFLNKLKNKLFPVPHAAIFGIFRFDRPYFLDYILEWVILSQCFFLSFVIAVFSVKIVDDFQDQPQLSWFLILILILPIIPTTIFFLPAFIEEFSFTLATACINRHVYNQISSRTQIRKVKQQFFSGLLDKFGDETTDLRELCAKCMEHVPHNRYGLVTFEKFKNGILDMNILLTDKDIHILFNSIVEETKSDGLDFFFSCLF